MSKSIVYTPKAIMFTPFGLLVACDPMPPL